MKGMPHYRQYPMGDVVNANLEPGEYVVRRNAVNALGTENMELLNQADGAHGNLNKLIVSADLENKLVQDNAPEKSDVNGYPIANSPVRQRVDATRNMQEGGEVEDDPVMFPAGKNIFGQPTEDMSQSQMSDMLLDMMTGGVGGTVKGVGKVLKGTQMKLFPSKALKRMSKTGKKSTKKKSAKEYLETAKERENRLWSDTDLAYKSGDNRLAEKFLEEHGYRPYLGQGSKEFTYKYTDKGLKAFTPYEGVKSGIEQKTFKNPTFKALRDWMGYQEGGMVHGYQEGGQVPTGNWGPPGAYNEALQKDRKENIGSNNLKSLSILEQLRLINAGTGVEPERLEQLNPERQIKERGSIFNRPDSNEYNMPTFQGDPGASRTPVVRAPSDNYGGNEIEKNLDVLIPYLQSYGRMKTPIQEKTEFLYNRLGVNPEQPPSSLQGLQGAALLQRLGSEGI
tara:strand:- start:1641 stop:2996 length:1356 start_codon:yes stop_codon:yes gene_type:complete